jgi:hypothetical protein
MAKGFKPKTDGPGMKTILLFLAGAFIVLLFFSRFMKGKENGGREMYTNYKKPMKGEGMNTMMSQ